MVPVGTPPQGCRSVPEVAPDGTAGGQPEAESPASESGHSTSVHLPQLPAAFFLPLIFGTSRIDLGEDSTISSPLGAPAPQNRSISSTPPTPGSHWGSLNASAHTATYTRGRSLLSQTLQS